MTISTMLRFAALTCCTVAASAFGGEPELGIPYSRPFTINHLDVYSRSFTVNHRTVVVSHPITISRYSAHSRPFTVFTCEEGACCLPQFQCSMTTPAECATLGGSFQGLCTECPPQFAFRVREFGGVFIHVIGPIIPCESVGAAPQPESGAPFIDPWESPADAEMCQNFGVPGSPAIPANFFDPDSNPFTDSICLEGTPLGLTPFGEFGIADTLARRTKDPFGLCDLPSATEHTVAAEVVALSLVGTAPITVTFNGGQNPQQWNVFVDLSPITAPPGSVTATKSHCNGGTYTSVLNVQVRFTFTKVGDPSQIRVLDTGLAGIPPVNLIQVLPMPWVSRLHPALNLIGDPNSAFHPAIQEMFPTTDCDCNGMLIHDLCDIEAKTSEDCNANDVPDECEIAGGVINDCNANGEPDTCEIANCTSDPACFDCNFNGIPDGCDIALGTSPDNNANGLPDQCEGACCLPDGTCSDTETSASCTSQNGVFRGTFCGCEVTSCPVMTTGACCLPDLPCAENLPFAECASQGGVYQGNGSLCVNVSACEGQDADADGVLDANDVCNNTPAGIAVDMQGRPLADADLDCDVDLLDFALFIDAGNFSVLSYAVFQDNFTGPLTAP